MMPAALLRAEAAADDDGIAAAAVEVRTEEYAVVVPVRAFPRPPPALVAFLLSCCSSLSGRAK